MLPGNKSFKVYKGDTFAFLMTLSSNDNSFNLSGYTLKGQIKEKSKSETIASFTFNVVDENGGQVQAVLTSEESAKLIGNRLYEYDIQINNNGVISTILRGPIIVVADVTQ